MSQRQKERWIVAVHSEIGAEGPITDGYSVMPWGGFYGSDSAMTRGELARLVADGELRFVDTGGFALGDPNQIGQLVSQACLHIDPSVWGGSGVGTLYDCAGRASGNCTIKLSAPAGPAISGAAPGGFKLGPASAVERLVTCLNDHHWHPTATSAGPVESRGDAGAAGMRGPYPCCSARSSVMLNCFSGLSIAVWCGFARQNLDRC